MATIKWDKADTFEGTTTWTFDVLGPDGEEVGWGEIERSKPSRYHANGVSGLVQDRAAPWQWHGFFRTGDGEAADEVVIPIPDGTGACQAKKIAYEKITKSLES